MKVAIASDHAGFCQKQDIVDYVDSLGFEALDLGPDSDERVDYPDYAAKVANQVSSEMCDFGILICGTGIGMAIAANKVDGIRAANVTDPQFAKLAREHNDANIITLSSRFVDLETNKSSIKAFLETQFGSGRHSERVEKIKRLESERG